MLILRIKQAEVALADGRLEEACELVQAMDLRSHRKGQELVSQLVAAFVKRGQEHLAAGRCQQAFADAQRAFKLGGNRPEISQLQTAVASALMDRQNLQHRKADAAAAARQRLNDGQITMAQNLLAGANPDGGQEVPLLREAAERRGSAETALTQARDALDREDLDAAIRLLLDAKGLHGSNVQVAELATRVVGLVTHEVRETIDQGRLDRAQGWIQRLVPLSGRTMDVQELGRVLEQCRLAGQCVQTGRSGEAERILRQLAAILPEAKWLKGAIEAAGQAATALEHLRTGPLGLIVLLPDALAERQGPAMPDTSRQQVTVKLNGRDAAQSMGLPERFMLHVDGIGSYLVARGRSVTIGPARSTDSPDVPLLAEAGVAAVTIERADEDYFLRSKETVFVNEHAATKRLLADGDQVALSARCRMKFSVPNAASTSAVLQLSGTRLPRTDARRVILLDRELIIGPGAASHVRADMLAEPVVLYVRDGHLCCRAKEPVMAGEQVLEGPAGLPMATSIRIGSVSLVVTQV